MDLKSLKLTTKRLQICERLDLKDSLDILSYYPFRYEYLSKTNYDDFKVGEQVCFEAELISYPSTFRYGKLNSTKFKVLYEEEEISVTIFNRPWVKNIKMNNTLTIIGKYDGNNKVTATNYYEKSIEEVTGILPMYASKEGISQNEIKKLISLVYEKCEDELIDNIPNSYIEQHHLISFKDAIKNIHFPTDKNELKKAISRLKYEEFLRFYIALDVIKGVSKQTIKNRKEFEINKVNDFINSFPFELTSDQVKCKDDILNDLQSNKIK